MKNVLPFCALILLGTACSTVTTTQPLPRPEKPVDKAAYEGIWLFTDGESGVIDARFNEDGVLLFASMERGRDHKLRFTDGEATLAEGKHHRFLSFRGDESGEPNPPRFAEGEDEYFFVCYTLIEGELFIYWEPVVDAFADLVESGELAGTVERDGHSSTVTLEAEPSTLLEVLDGPLNAKLFDYQNPKVLRRIAK